MTANELSSTTRQHVLGDMRQGNQKTAPVSLVSVVTEDDHEINMQLPWAANTQQAAEEQTRQQRSRACPATTL